jgi:hypothetical protein
VAALKFWQPCLPSCCVIASLKRAANFHILHAWNNVNNTQGSETVSPYSTRHHSKICVHLKMCPYYTEIVSWTQWNALNSFIHSFTALACAECDVSLPFSEASSNPLCYIRFPVTFLHQLFFHPPTLLAIYVLVCFLVSLISNSYTILFLEFYFLLFSVHVQTSVLYVALLSLLW